MPCCGPGYRFNFKGVIDYVFHSKQHLSVLGILGPIDSQWVKDNKIVGFPHPHVPSDHFPLLVEFEMLSQSSSNSGGSGGAGGQAMSNGIINMRR